MLDIYLLYIDFLFFCFGGGGGVHGQGYMGCLIQNNLKISRVPFPPPPPKKKKKKYI